MVITIINGWKYTGLSTDIKPTSGVNNGAVFYEIDGVDAPNIYTFEQSSWIQTGMGWNNEKSVIDHIKNEYFLNGLNGEKLVFLSDDNPSGNFAALNTALSTGGKVYIPKSGTYTLNDTIVIPSNTKLVLGHGVILKQAPGTNKKMLANSAYTAAATNVILTWSAGYQMSVAWADHGFAVGDYVSIYSVSPSHYIGVFRVNGITDTDNFTVRLKRLPLTTPTALSGSVVAKRADVNISIEGGKWDYDYANNGASDTLERFALLVGHCAHLRIDTHVDNALKFCVMVGAVADYSVKLRVDKTNSDGIKVYGPAFDGYCECNGFSGDDMITVHTRESTTYAAYRWTYGDILDARICSQGEALGAGGALVGVYMSQNEYVDGIVFENVSGIANGNAVKINGDNTVGTASGGNAGKITLKNYTAVGLSTGAIVVTHCTVKQLLMQDLNPKLTGTFDAVFVTGVAAACVIDTLTFENVVFSPDLAYSGAGFPFVLSASIKTLNIKGGLYTKGLPYMIQATGSLIRTVNISDLAVEGLPSQFVRLDSSVTGNKVHFNIMHNDIKGIQFIGAYGAGGCSVNISGNRFDGLTGGVVRCNAASQPIHISSGGNEWLNGSVGATRNLGSELITVNGADIPADPTILVRAAGSMCFNKAAAAGTLVQNNVIVCDATGGANSWKQLSNTALTY